jgi:hypothetical protein
MIVDGVVLVISLKSARIARNSTGRLFTEEGVTTS